MEPETAEARRVGTLVAGKYRLDAFLSRGGMGAVYRATHVMLGRPCAVKVIRPDLVTSAELVGRFLREARAAAALDHPNIVKIFDLGEAEDGTLYIAMELVEGRSLSEVIRQDGALEPRRIVSLLRQVASALALAHARKVVHRDLKPQNLMIAAGRDGRETVKLLDFGIAKTFDEETALTATGLVLGTPQYMAPEQVSGGPIDHRADLYALGVILYEMMAGDVPFHAPSTPALLMKHVNEPPEPPSRRRPDLALPPGLEAVALRCLEKDPARRYPSAEAFGAALDAALEPDAGEAQTVPLRRGEGSRATRREGVASTPAGVGEEPAAARTPAGARGSQRRRVLAWAMAAAVGGAGVVMLVMWSTGLFRSRTPDVEGSTPPVVRTAAAEGAGEADPIRPPASSESSGRARGAERATTAAASPPRDAGVVARGGRAFTGPPPRVPSVWIDCVGGQEVCGSFRLALARAIEEAELVEADSRDRAEVVVAVRATSPEGTESPGGLMWERRYVVRVDGRAPRFGLAVPMPPPESLTFDVHFGSDVVMEVARRMAGEVVVEIRRFWTRHVVIGR